MSLFEYIDSTEDVGLLRKIYNNLPGNVDLLTKVTKKPSHEECIKAKIYTLERINELNGYTS